MLEYVIVFALLLLIGFGLPLPEESVLLLAAYFVATGFDFAFLFLVCVLGIVLSDTVQFVRGRLRARVFSKFKQGKNFVASAGFFAVFTSRFFISSRVVMPFMAGAMQMNKLRFHFASILGAVVWSVVILIGGSFIFSFLDRLTSYATLIWSILIMLLTGVLIMYATRSQVQITK